mgnify:CR=1 FL=1
MIDFIHIPKNAGTSIQEICAPNLEGSFITYHGHGTDPGTLDGEQLVILRDPKDRFCSAVRYSLAFMRDNEDGDPDKYHDFETRDLVDPNSWIEVLVDINHKQYDLVSREIRNVNHKVGNMHLDDKWTYTPQHIWLNRCCCPRVALFHELSDDIRYIFTSMNCHINYDIPHENAVFKPRNFELSDIAHEYLDKKYHEDIMIFNKYKTMTKEARLGHHCG